MSESGEHRVEFDFELSFSNGGGMQGQGFRMDIADDEISDQDLIALVSLVGWLRRNRDEIARMPVSQPSDTAPIPLSGRE